MQRTVTVKGVGAVSLKPDYIEITLNILSKSSEYSEAVSAANAAIGRLKSAVTSVGFADDDLKTLNFNVKTNYENEADDMGRYRRVFRGYMCGYRLKLSFDMNVELLSRTIDAIAASGADAELSKMFKKYDVTSMPVVDSENRLVGIITIDDIMDIIEEETTEDIEKMAAIVPTEKPYLNLGLWDIYKSRMPWLLFLMISATFTGAIIANYESALASYATLTVFIPMIMGTGGNAGGQSSVTIIRALSLNEVKFKDSIKVLAKEFSVGIICGLTLAICNFIKLLVFDKISILFASIVCIALFLTVMLAKIIGAILPILADKIHLDPAVMANPIITTIVDALSLLVYFQIASAFLGL